MSYLSWSTLISEVSRYMTVERRWTIFLTVPAFRVAHDTSYPPAVAHTVRDIYHTLLPHPALSPVPRDGDPSSLLEQARNEEAWRQLLVQGILALLLPTEELANDCLRVLVTDIFSDMILGNGVSQKACEPWLLWDAITTIIKVSGPSSSASRETATVAASQLEQFGLVSHPENDEHEFRRGLMHAWSPDAAAAAAASASRLFWTMAQLFFFAFVAARTFVYAVANFSSLPPRSKTWLPVQPWRSADSKDTKHVDMTDGLDTNQAEISPSNDHRPILSMSLWKAAARLVELDLRMPWLSGLLKLAHHVAMFGPGRLGTLDGSVDR